MDLFALFLLIATAAAPIIRAHPAGELAVRVLPARPYIEVSESTQYLNFDFHIENQTDQVLRLRRIYLTVADDSGEPVLRRVLDERAMVPSIDLVTDRDLEPNSALFLFNPFYFFDREVPLASLEYEFHFSTPGDSMLSPVTVSVRPVRYEDKTALMIPLRGRVLVEDGHDFYSHHRRVDLSHPMVVQAGFKTNPQRFALDLTLSDTRGLPYTGHGGYLKDWYGYGANVYAPGDGTVIRVVDGIPDNTLEDGRVVHSDAVSPENLETLAGNYLVLDHGNGEYSVLSHLKEGSFRVKEGETVRQGHALATIGFSGDTSNVVHVHYQLQTGPGFFNAETLPVYFRNFRRHVGSRTVEVAHGPIDTGDIVDSLTAPSP